MSARLLAHCPAQSDTVTHICNLRRQIIAGDKPGYLVTHLLAHYQARDSGKAL